MRLINVLARNKVQMIKSESGVSFLKIRNRQNNVCFIRFPIRYEKAGLYRQPKSDWGSFLAAEVLEGIFGSIDLHVLTRIMSFSLK